jgi:hypothetical protein
MEREDRVRRYFLKSIHKSCEISPTEIDSESELSQAEIDGIKDGSLVLSGQTRKIKVVDRFGMIL